MKILVTGANGYIGHRLIPKLVEGGHEVIALVRSAMRFVLPPNLHSSVKIIEADLLDLASLNSIPEDIDAAYYLVHSMTNQDRPFDVLEMTCATNFIGRLKETKVKQIVYLSGLIGSEKLSQHLQSRLNVEQLIVKSGIPYTVLRAGIIIGSGSASFEIIRDLVEKLPIMIAPKWVSSQCQPIGIFDMLNYLYDVLGNKECYNHVFDVGGPEILTYKEMIQQLAEFRGLKRSIISVPVLTPRLSGYWLYFVTSISFPLAMALVESLKCDAICKDFRIQKILPRKCMSYRETIERAFLKIEQKTVPSSWKDALVRSELNPNLTNYFTIPTSGCLKDIQKVPLETSKREAIEKLWRIGGSQGWYYWDWAWGIRGFMDKLCGGVGLRRGRTHTDDLSVGDALDFWRVLHADKSSGELLLYAEMKLPGEAWLDFRFENDQLVQTATFRPKGILGRLYWYLLLPFHIFIFRGMAREVSKGNTEN